MHVVVGGLVDWIKTVINTGEVVCVVCVCCVSYWLFTNERVFLLKERENNLLIDF